MESKCLYVCFSKISAPQCWGVLEPRDFCMLDKHFSSKPHFQPHLLLHLYYILTLRVKEMPYKLKIKTTIHANSLMSNMFLGHFRMLLVKE